MQIACWAPKATNKPSEFVILIAFHAATMAARTRIIVTFIRKLLFLCYFTLNKTNNYATWKLLCSFKFCNKITSCICIARHHFVVLHWLANSPQSTNIKSLRLTNWRQKAYAGHSTYLLQGAFCSGRSCKPHNYNKHQTYQLRTLKLNYGMCTCIEKREMNKNVDRGAVDH